METAIRRCLPSRFHCRARRIAGNWNPRSAFAHNLRRKVPIRGRAGFPEDAWAACDVYDFAADRSRHQHLGAGAFECFSQNLGRTWPHFARSHPFFDIHDPLQPGLLGDPHGARKNITSAPKWMPSGLSGGANYKIITKNISRLDLRETSRATQIHIDGQELSVKGAPQITLEKAGVSWKVASGSWPGLHKTHALQGPIDDAFIEPFSGRASDGKALE